MRRLLTVCTGLLGLILLGADARWAGETSLEFRFELFGKLLWSGDREQFQAAIDRLVPWLFAGTGAISLTLGFAAARVAGRRGALLGFAMSALVFIACEPGIMEFVALRRADNAPRYLEVGDLLIAIGWGLFLLSAIAWCPQASKTDPDSGGQSAPKAGRNSVLAACVFAGLLPLLISQLTLSGEPLTNDGAAYRFQAELFADGQASRDIGVYSDFFPARQIQPGAQAFSKYPPGHSAVLASGQLLGVPRLLPFLLAALVPWLTWLLARRLQLRAPHRAAWLLALSPAVLGVQSLWLSHATSLPMCLLFSYASLTAFDELEGNRRSAAKWGLIAGVAISLAFAARPLTALAFAIPFLGFFALQARPGRLMVTLCALLGALPAAGFFLWINYQLTGSPFRTAYGLYADVVSPNDRWGLVNLGTALEYTRFNLSRLSAWTHGLVPGLWLVLLGATSGHRPQRSSLLWLPALALLLFYALHRFHGIPWVGPVYLAEAIPLLAILSAAGWNSLERRRGRLAGRILIAVLCLSSAQLLGRHLEISNAEIEHRALPRHLAEEQGIERGVVFVPLASETALRRYPLPAPNRTDALIFARDLGSRNAELLEWLNDPPAWRLDLVRRELIPLVP